MCEKIILYAYPTLSNPLSGGWGPHFRLEDGNFYREEGHPGGRDLWSASCYSDGDSLRKTFGNDHFEKKYKSWIARTLSSQGPIFKRIGDYLYTGSGHPDGEGHMYYELREKPEDKLRREQKQREEQERKEKEERARLQRELDQQEQERREKAKLVDRQIAAQKSISVQAQPTPLQPAPVQEVVQKWCTACLQSLAPPGKKYCDYCSGKGKWAKIASEHNARMAEEIAKIPPPVICPHCRKRTQGGAPLCGHCGGIIHSETTHEPASESQQASNTDKLETHSHAKDNDEKLSLEEQQPPEEIDWLKIL